MFLGEWVEGGEETHNLEQVVELAVDVTNDDDWLVDLDDIGFQLCMWREVLTRAVKRLIRLLTHSREGLTLLDSISLRRVMSICPFFYRCESEEDCIL